MGWYSGTTCNRIRSQTASYGSNEYVSTYTGSSSGNTYDESVTQIITFAVHTPECCTDAGISNVEVPHAQPCKGGFRRQARAFTDNRRTLQRVELAQTLPRRFPKVLASGVYREWHASADIRYRQRRIGDYRFCLQRPKHAAEEVVPVFDGVRRSENIDESPDNEEVEDDAGST